MLCNRGSANYLYFEVTLENLESFKFDETVTAKILDRYKYSHDGKIRFMVYNNQFLAGYQNLTRARYITFIHLILNVMVFIIMEYYVYERYFCFNFLHPIQSITDCESNV